MNTATKVVEFTNPGLVTAVSGNSNHILRITVHQFFKMLFYFQTLRKLNEQFKMINTLFD